MKKILINICCIGTTLFLFNSALAIDTVPNASKILLDGKEVTVQAYNVEGNNYFKLRDLAYILNGTDSQFSVGYDTATNSVYITSGQPYIPVGEELQNSLQQTTEAKIASAGIIKDGKTIDVTAYNINDCNYFKLRDIGKEIDFKVDYDSSSNSIIIETKNSQKQLTQNLDDEGFATDLITPAIPPTPTPH